MLYACVNARTYACTCYIYNYVGNERMHLRMHRSIDLRCRKPIQLCLYDMFIHSWLRNIPFIDFPRRKPRHFRLWSRWWVWLVSSHPTHSQGALVPVPVLPVPLSHDHRPVSNPICYTFVSAGGRIWPELHLWLQLHMHDVINHDNDYWYVLASD